METEVVGEEVAGDRHIHHTTAEAGEDGEEQEANRNEGRTFSIKCSINTCIADASIKTKIEKAVWMVSQGAVQGASVINETILRIEAGTMPWVDFKKDTSAIYAMFSPNVAAQATTPVDARVIAQLVATHFADWPNPRGAATTSKTDWAGINNIQTAAAHEYMTAMKNHVDFAFEARQFKHIQLLLWEAGIAPPIGLPKQRRTPAQVEGLAVCRAVQYYINQWVWTRSLPLPPAELPPAAQALLATEKLWWWGGAPNTNLRPLAVRKPTQRALPQNLPKVRTANLTKVFLYYLRVLREFERANVDHAANRAFRSLRLFPIVPTSALGRRFISIDTTPANGYLLRGRQRAAGDTETLEEWQTRVWSHILKPGCIDKLRTSKQRFGYSIKTDGVTIVVSMLEGQVEGGGRNGAYARVLVEQILVEQAAPVVTSYNGATADAIRVGAASGAGAMVEDSVDTVMAPPLPLSGAKRKRTVKSESAGVDGGVGVAAKRSRASTSTRTAVHLLPPPSASEAVAPPHSHSMHLGPQRVIALDPGRISIWTSAEKRVDGSWRHHKYTRGQFYRESGTTARTQKAATWNRQLDAEARAEWDGATCKTANWTTWLAYKATYVRHFHTLWVHKMQKKWARADFRFYCLKRKSLDRFINIMTAPETHVRQVVPVHTRKQKRKGKEKKKKLKQQPKLSCSVTAATVPKAKSTSVTRTTATPPVYRPPVSIATGIVIPRRARDTRPVVFAYGDATIQSSAKFEKAAPVSWQKKKLEERFRGHVHAVNEFRSTKLCHGCASPTGVLTAIHNTNPHPANPSAGIPYVTLHGLRWCPPCRAFLDRDINAARNICEVGYLQFAEAELEAWTSPTDATVSFAVPATHYLSPSHAAVPVPRMSKCLGTTRRDQCKWRALVRAARVAVF